MTTKKVYKIPGAVPALNPPSSPPLVKPWVTLKHTPLPGVVVGSGVLGTIRRIDQRRLCL